MKNIASILLFLLFFPLTSYSQSRDSELLGRALEYYGSQKYHESLLVFEQLRKTYKLNSRFLAYMGVCYYKEQKYEDAAKILDKVIPDLEPFPPHERAVYYFSNAESHFLLGLENEERRGIKATGKNKEIETAAQYYEKTIPVCFSKEKGDVYYRLGFCHLLNVETELAMDYFSKAKSWYDKYGSMDAQTSFRKNQTENMLHSLLVAHRASRMDEGNEETWENKNENADKKSDNVEQKQ